MKSNATLVYNLCLVIGDFLALVAAFVGAFIIRANSSTPVAHPIHASTYIGVFVALLPFWILVFALLGLYNANIYERRFAEFGRLLIGSFIGLLFVVFWNFLSVNPIFPAKLVPIYGFLLSFVFLVLFRNAARAIRTELFGFGIGLTRVLVVGSTTVTDELVGSLADSRHSGYEVIGIVSGKEHNRVPTYHTFRAFLESTRARSLHGIIQTELYKDEARNREVLEYAQTHHVSYRFIPGNTELFVGNLDVELFRNSIPVIAVRQTPLFGWGRVVKRLFDLIVGSTLLILTSPLWLLCIILLKISEPHSPVFYRPERLTRFGTSVNILKFRTMKGAYNGLSPEEGFKKMGRPELIKAYRENGDQLPNDPRAGHVGIFLKVTSLDELPQLWNIVRGDLSLVGPRALDKFELEHYEKKNLILSVKSGWTGLALVSGRRGISFEERRKLDIYYVQNWSFWLDMVILAKTVRVVLERLARRGARY